MARPGRYFGYRRNGGRREVSGTDVKSGAVVREQARRPEGREQARRPSKDVVSVESDPDSGSTDEMDAWPSGLAGRSCGGDPLRQLGGRW